MNSLSLTEFAGRMQDDVMYMASPYTSVRPLDMHLRHEHAAFVLAQLMLEDLTVITRAFTNRD